MSDPLDLEAIRRRIDRGNVVKIDRADGLTGAPEGAVFCLLEENFRTVFFEDVPSLIMEVEALRAKLR